MTRQLVLCLIVVVAAGQSGFAQPFIERVWPPVLQRGQATRVEFSGTQLQQPLGVWTSVPGVDIQGVPTGMATEDTVSVDLTIPPTAPLGLYGLRLATASGPSNVHLFLIDELPVTVVNRSVAEVQPISLPACVVSPVRKAHVDRYAIDVSTGQRVTLEVIGNRLGKNFDPVVTIKDSQGKFVARCDNSIGLLFDCRFAHTFAAAGRYIIEVIDSRFAGEPSWSYVLRVGDFPEARTAVPAAVPLGQETVLAFPQTLGFAAAAKPQALPRTLSYFQEIRFAPEKPATWIPLAVSNRQTFIEQEPNNSPKQALTAASPISLSAELCGVLSEPGDEDWFQFPLAKGQSLRVRSFTQSIGSAADLEILLYEPTNERPPKDELREVVRNDETNLFEPSRNSTFYEEANLTFGARTDGLHKLLIRDLTGAGSPAHTYRIELGENLPELKLKSDISEIALPRGTWQPWPLTITRTGFNGPVELELVGAPAGVVLEPTAIPEDAKDFVCKLSASKDLPEGLATLQLIGRAAANDRVLETVATVHPLVDRQLMNKDRLIFALRPDQRELPPSLTDRIALQVMPPPPFDFVLPDPQVMMPKYQTAQLRIETRREPGFAAPITFTPRGGQIGDEREERVQVYFNAPPATVETPNIVGTFANRILTGYQKHRVDVTATAMFNGHAVNLTRTFQMEVRPAFEPKFEPADIMILPGEKLAVKLTANRVPTFDGELTLTNQNPQSMFVAPEQLVFPKGQPELPLEIAIKPETNPGRYELRYESNAYVGRFQESVRSAVLVINVKKPEPKK
jgi:hypothetical protein